jgi:hypothetical protein
MTREFFCLAESKKKFSKQKTKTKMDELRNALEGEYNNAGELLGIDTSMDGELSRYLNGLGAIERAKIIQKLTAKPAHSRGSRAEFEKFFKEVPDSVKSELLSGKLRLSDYTIYNIKHVASKTVKMFETQDDREVGLSNIDKAKLGKNFVFLVSGIYVLAGVSADMTDDKIKATDFASIKAIPAIANAEFSLKANKKQIIPEGNILRKFITDNNHNVALGYWKLDNPRLIKDDELIEFVIELGTMDGVAATTHILVGLDGTGTTP